MKKTFIILVALVLSVFSGCMANRETSSGSSNTEMSNIDNDTSVNDESVENPLSTECWETTSKKDGNDVLRKFTKEYNGDIDSYNITAVEYTNGELTGKIITVYTDGEKTHDEEYRYNGDTLIYSDKSDYAPNASIPFFSSVYGINEYENGFAYYKSETYYSEDGAIIEGLRTNYNEDGTIHSTEEYSQKELDGYACTYFIITYYKNNVATGITHRAYDRNMNYFYTEERTGDDVILYAKKSFDGICMYIFPEVGNMSVSGTEYEFFEPNGNTVAKGRLENNIMNLYENTSNLSVQEALDIVNDILSKAQEFGFLPNS